MRIDLMRGELVEVKGSATTGEQANEWRELSLNILLWEQKQG